MDSNGSAKINFEYVKKNVHQREFKEFNLFKSIFHKKFLSNIN